MAKKLKDEILAEYRAARYTTVLQDHRPATILQNALWLPAEIISSVRKPLASFLRLETR